MRLMVFYFLLILVVTCGGCASLDGDGGPSPLEIIMTDPMDPDGVLEDPIIPKPKVEPAKEPEIQSSNNLDKAIGNGLIGILVWHHTPEPVFQICFAPAAFPAVGFFVHLAGLEPAASTMSM